MIKTERIYAVKEGDGFRVLVDRLWPRGISREKAKLDLWMKEQSGMHSGRDILKSWMPNKSLLINLLIKQEMATSCFYLGPGMSFIIMRSH